MPFQSKLTTQEEIDLFEEAKQQHFLIDEGGRFTTSPLGLTYLNWCEGKQVPYIIVRKRDSWCDVYIDLPGKQKFTVTGFNGMLLIFQILANVTKELHNQEAAFRVTADNAQYEDCPFYLLEALVNTAFTIASEGTSEDFISLRTLQRLQKNNTAKETCW